MTAHTQGVFPMNVYVLGTSWHPLFRYSLADCECRDICVNPGHRLLHLKIPMTLVFVINTQVWTEQPLQFSKNRGYPNAGQS